MKEAGLLYSVLWPCVVGGPGRALWRSIWSRLVSRCRYVEGEVGKGLVGGEFFWVFFIFFKIRE